MKKIERGIVVLLGIVLGVAVTGFSRVAEVKDHLGAPMLFIDGKPQPPLMFLGYGADLVDDPNCPFARQAGLAKKVGMHIYTFPVDFVWLREGEEPDFSRVDAAYDKILEFDPEALLIPRFGIHPPQWMFARNPDLQVAFSDGVKGSFSVASKPWRARMEKSLRAYVRHCEAKYGDHIIGYHPCGLSTAEWFYEKSWEKVYSQFEEPFRSGFAEWVENKYGTVAALRKAWGNDAVDFEQISLPTAEERGKHSNGFFRDPVKDRFVIDFYEYKPVAIAEVLHRVARVVKEETRRTKLVIFFYGYTFELAGVPLGPQVTGHLGMKQVLASPDIDILVAPISYGERNAGGIGSFMAAVDSVRRAGKLWLNEDDTRTHLSDLTQIFGRVETLQETEWVHDRNFGHILPRRMGCWYMDLFNKAWLDSPELWENLGHLNQIYRQELDEKFRWNPEVAVVVDERSPYYLSTSNQLTASLYSGLRSQFYRMGTSFSLYLLSDVLEGRVELPKVTLFLGAWYLEGRERETLKAALKGKTAIWFYGAGYLSESGASTDQMAELTGFDFKQSERRKSTITFNGDSKWNSGLEYAAFDPVYLLMEPKKWASIQKPVTLEYTPAWSVEKQPGTQSLAAFEDGATALALKNCEGFRSIYCGITSLPSQFLRNVLKNSGVHLYLDSDDVVSTDGHFLSVSASQAGYKTLSIGKGKRLLRLDSGEEVETHNGVLREKYQLGETRFFWIEKP